MTNPEARNTTFSILFLAADPTDLSRLRLGEEHREIQEQLQLSKLRERFKLHTQMSTRPVDISQALLNLQPQIVHFSGHGKATGALCVEDQQGNAHPIDPETLAALFEQFSGLVNCVVLNACYSEIQADAIARYIDYVIGMNQTIDDRAAIAFAVGFYQALGAGRTIEDAFKLGCVQIRLQGIPDYLKPVLIKNQGKFDNSLPAQLQEAPSLNSNPSHPIIVDASKLIDSQIADIEKAIGKPIEIDAVGIGDLDEIPDGGQTRIYEVGKYTIYVNYDKKGIALGLQVIAGLEAENYPLDHWPFLLSRLGVTVVSKPDIDAPAARRWSNYRGYAMWIVANKIGGPVWSMKIHKLPK